MRAFEYFQIEIYVALAVGATIMADQIHRVIISLSDINIQLASEDSRKTLQLREVAHRVANNFACLDALIRQRAMASLRIPRFNSHSDRQASLCTSSHG